MAQRSTHDQDTEQLRLATLAALAFAWAWDIESDVLVWVVSPETLLGPRPDSGRYPDFRDMVYPEDREAFLAAGRAAMNAVSSARPVADYACDARLVRTDGVVRWFHARGKAYAGAAGRAVKMIGVTTDVHDQRIAEQRLAESEARFKSLLALSSDWYWEQDEQFRFTFISDGVGERSGISADAHLGYTRWSIPALNLTREDWARHQAMLERREPFRDFEVRRPDKDGRARWLSISGEAVFDPAGRFRGYRGTGRDISARKRTETALRDLGENLELRVTERTAELEATTRELEAFANSVAHYLKGPLRAIDGFAHLLGEEEGERISASGRRRLETIVANTVRMGALIDGLLDLAHWSRCPLTKKAVDFAALAASVVDERRGAYPAASVTLDPLPKVVGDAALLRQALACLVDNAFKFSSGRAEPQVQIGWSESERACYVRDNGVGFGSQHAERLFQVFERLHNEKEFAGIGIGLAIARRVVERHGGRVWAHCGPGQGTSFYFALPTA